MEANRSKKAGVGHNLRGQRPGTRALLGAGRARLRPPRTAHGSHSSAVFDNCPDFGVKAPHWFRTSGSYKYMPKPNDAWQPMRLGRYS
jgi:hypothetical protein